MCLPGFHLETALFRNLGINLSRQRRDLCAVPNVRLRAIPVAKEILTKHKKVLDEGAALVLKEENIEGDRLKELLEPDQKA
jgi:hypothetical protein